MKKFAKVFLGTVTALSLAGCGGTSAVTETASETVQTTSEITEAVTERAVHTETELNGVAEENKSIYEQCLENFTEEYACLGTEYIYDTEVYDIDGDGCDELLILYYGVARGADLHVYKMYEDDFVYCGRIISLVGKLNEHIYDFPVYTPEFYDEIDIKKYNYGGAEYNVLLFSDRTFAAQYNFVAALDIDENNQLYETTILGWGVDLQTGARGTEAIPHQSFYLDGEKEITAEEVLYYLGFVS